jgi:outer membrane receptor for ferrienterochelin and colicins
MKRFPLLLLLSPLTLIAHAQEAAAPQRVEVKGDVLRAQDAATARQVVGRSAILAYGEGNLAEVLKRQSGVSVVGGEVRLRGLGGAYTQVLVDGEPVPQGFSIDSIAPDLVERIEIARSPTADRSAGAVAGSINIVLRKRGSGLRREDKAALGVQHGHASPSVSSTVNGKRGTLAWSLGANYDRDNRSDTVRTDETVADNAGIVTARRFSAESQGSVERLNLAPRLNWTFENGDTLAWQTLLGATRSRNRVEEEEATRIGRPSSYPETRAFFAARTSSLRSDLAWAHRFDGAGKLTVKGVVDASRRRSDYLFLGTRADGMQGLARAVAAGQDERTGSLNGKYLAPLGSAHGLGLGWDASRTTRDERRDQFDTIDGVAHAFVLLQDYTARVDRLALFAQDEWSVSPALEAYLGVRWEGLRTATFGADLARVRGSSGVASPILQLLWKLPAKSQLRMALARTYKAPLTRDLVPRRYTINNNNNAANPDVEGNPDLRPELSWGLDLAYERPLGKDGSASVAAYGKRVSDVTTRQLYRDGAAWVARPINDGRADVAGIEIDVKAPVRLGDAHLELRANASRNWSRVEKVPGPDNTLAEQVPFAANAGIDYRGSDIWSAGTNLNIQGAQTSRTADGVRTWRERTALWDLYWTRKFARNWRLRLSAANLLGKGQQTDVAYRDADGRETARRQRSEAWPSLRFALERGL